ncbi:MAG: 16S rRNA (guanine(966)-N(2))-methyltransferase RsmD [Coriobacteriia bacterium]|nr:16S rRNA (guanine(966)-N(2))-methyltransferase RsmD [Coriobacteriia bacterium]
MRIVAGRWRGRRLSAPRGRLTRPTSDRVREAVFSVLTSQLGPDLAAAGVLDLFAGSGALGLEALSRGAAAATFVERDPAALMALLANIEALEAGGRARVVAADAAAAVRRPLPGAPYSLLFLDPPYRIEPAEVGRAVEHLARAGALKRGAVAVWEHAAERRPEWPGGFAPEEPRRYGRTSVAIAAYTGGAGTDS